MVNSISGSDCADVLVEDGDLIRVGGQQVSVPEKPGQTNICVTWQVDGAVFTGDALLIRGWGHTDFHSGDPGSLYDSIHQKLFGLPDDTIVYPGHD